MWWIYLPLGVTALGVAVYLYFFTKRMVSTFTHATGKLWVKLLIGAVALGASVFCLNIKSFGLIILLHVIFLAFLVQLGNFLVKCIAKDNYQKGFGVWKKIYGSGMIPLVLAFFILLGGHINLNTVTKTSYTVVTDKNIREEGYRVALIADVHYGVSLGKEELVKKCEEISEENVDLVILCGDLVDDDTSREELEEVFDALGEIESQYGIFYVFGNHDRPMAALESEYTEEELIGTIEKNGIVILQDDVVTVNEDLVLIGREDRSAEGRRGGREALATLLSGVDQDNFILTLDHQPNDYEENARLGTDLLLSGHTHGGQLFPVNILQELVPFNEGVYGRYELDEDSVAIVTSGFAGWAYPVKTAAPAEYVIIDIQEK